MKKHAKKLFSLSLALLLAFTCFLSYRQADATSANGEAGHFFVTVGNSGEWNYDDTSYSDYAVISITGSGTYTIRKDCDCDEDEVHAGYQIKIGEGIKVTLTIEDVQISNSSNAAMSIDGSAEVTLVLEGNNTFDSSTVTNNRHAGIEFNDAETGSLTITSYIGGYLTAKGGQWGAGIGGGSGSSGNYITISGGAVTAIGGEYAAGIGGGYGAYSGGNGTNITIEGGIVTATSPDGGAGIGGGYEGNGSTIDISGGIVTATGGAWGAGIGGGHTGNGSTIDISGGIVTATGGTLAAGIGGGYKGGGSNITISGGYITATATANGVGYSGQAIGNGDSASGQASVTVNYDNACYYRTSSSGTFDSKSSSDVDVTTSYVEMYDADYYTDGHFIVVPAGDSTDWSFNGNSSKISIEDDGTYIISEICGEDTVHSGYQILVDDELKANIILDNVQIKNTSGASMSIYGEADVTLVLVGDNSFTSADYYAGIQFNDSKDGSLTIIAGTADGSVTATGGKRGAGIGGGRNITDDIGYSGNNITITSGTVTATGGSYAAGIGAGGGDNQSSAGGSGSNITISGGTIIANGGMRGAGIGGSYKGSASITITGGTITATGGGSAPGIGSGYANAEGTTTTITITGGNITATGEGAGIGAGIYAKGSTTIDISGGTITATGAASSAGIGGGSSAYEGASTIIKISGGNVTATSSSAAYGGGAGIGSGNNSSDNTTIEISGGNITATGVASTYDDKGSAGIGSGYNNSGTIDIKISGGTITATGGGSAAGIGDGMSSSGAEVIISNGSVKASSISNPTDGSGNEVYLLKIPNMLDIDRVMVDDTEYTRSGNHWDEDDYDDGTFYLYLTGRDHEVTAGGKNYRAVWNEDEKTLTLKEYVETPSATFTATDEDSGRLTNVDTTMKYSVDGGKNWISIEYDDIYDQDKTNITDVTATNGIQIYIETETTISYIQTIKVTQAATPNVDSEDCTIDENGKITNVDDTMEYRKEGVSEWIDITGNEVTGLSAGTYYVRVKASDKQLASSSVKVTISAYVGSSTSDPTDFNDGTGTASDTYDGATLVAGASGQIIVNTSAGSTSKED